MIKKINLSHSKINVEEKRKKNISRSEFNNIRFTQSNKIPKNKKSKIVIPKYLKEDLKKETKLINTEYNILNNNEILLSQQGILELNAIKRLNGNNNKFKEIIQDIKNYINQRKIQEMNHLK